MIQRKSYRDPDGQLMEIDGRFVRAVFSSGLPSLKLFFESETASAFKKEGALIPGTRARWEQVRKEFGPLSREAWPGADLATEFIEHPAISFPNFPYEWSPLQLHAAGELTLRLADSLLGEGAGLKDATPYNIQFDGPNPVFLDALSFQPRDRFDSTWLAYGQFVRTFVLPLLVNREFGLPLRSLLAMSREGLDPETVYRLAGPAKRLKPPFLGAVTLPTLLGRNAPSPRTYAGRRERSAEAAEYILRHLYSQLRRSLNRAKPRTERWRSAWSAYRDGEGSYSASERQAKREFVQAAFREIAPRRVLDLGCNDGSFSVLAAQSGASVVAVDSDEIVIDRLWGEARKSRLRITPLVVDIARPSPALGWCNKECGSFLQRASGSFDMVIMLALMHHLMVGDGVPLPEILGLAAGLTNRYALIEYVAPEDPMFRQVCRGRDSLYTFYCEESFLNTARKHFDLLHSINVSKTRSLYLLERSSIEVPKN